jgi:hypothetical protein
MVYVFEFMGRDKNNKNNKYNGSSGSNNMSTIRDFPLKIYSYSACQILIPRPHNPSCY